RSHRPARARAAARPQTASAARTDSDTAAAVPAAGVRTWTATPAAAALPAAASIAHQPGREGAAALGRAACGCAAPGPIALGLSALGRVAPGWAGLGGSSATRAAPNTNHQRAPRGRVSQRVTE